MMRSIIGAIVVGLAAALPATASALSIDFRTPGRAAYCDYSPRGEASEGGPNQRTDLYCWTPNDGFYVDMHAPAMSSVTPTRSS
jgi:hypothetical protein